MTFRTRVTLLGSLAVAAALIGASVIIDYSYRHQQTRQVDGELAASLTVSPVKNLLANPASAGGPAIQVVLPGSSTALKVHITRPALIPSGAGATGPLEYSTVAVNGMPERQLTIFGARSSITIRRSLVDVKRGEARLRWLLIVICLGGIGVAALLGLLVSGRVVAPLRRLTEATERITETGQLSERTGQRGRDEIGRLSAQLDALLACLEESVHAQRQLVADASHELRTPLATLRLNVNSLRANNMDGRERVELIDDVEEELESMTTLVGELVELAHGEEVDIEATEFRLDQVVRSAINRAAKRTKQVSFRADLEATTVLGVPERVERAVDNLLDNARKWSPAGGIVDVSVKEGVVEIRDRGPGIAGEEASLVFNRFYRSVEARGTPGAGLGLAIVKQVAEAHKGSISIHDAPGGGAILRLSLLRSS